MQHPSWNTSLGLRAAAEVHMIEPPAAAPDIDLTLEAARRVAGLIAAEAQPGLKLRVYVSGGGCSGFQYNFALDEGANEDDFVLDRHGVTLLVDATSLQYLNGASIDYQEGLQGSRFLITNPNADATCGCGMSFSA